MLDLSTILKEASKVNFIKVVSRPLAPLVSDILQTPLADRISYSQFIGKSFSYKNLFISDGDIYDDALLTQIEYDICNDIYSTDYLWFHHKAKCAEKFGYALLMWSINVKKLHLNNNIPQLFANYRFVSNDLIPFLTFTLTVGKLLELKIKEKLIRHNFSSQHIDEITLQLTTPTRHSIHTQERISLLELAINKNRNSLDIDIHHRLFSSIGFNWGVGNILSIDDIEEQLSSLVDPKSELDLIKSNRKDVVTTRNLILDNLVFDSELLQLLDLAKKYVWLRSFRTAILSMSFGNISHLINNYYIHLGYQQNDYLHLTSEEILSCTKISDDELNERKRSFSIIYLDGIKTFISGDNSVKIHNLIDPTDNPIYNLNGTTTCRPVSKVYGKVHLIKSAFDLKFISDNVVVVTSMTTPNYIPFMKKAAGIITDEGGMLCHASIISRELKIPCIVGTKYATRVLKTGDLINMDLNSGSIRIALSSSE